MFELSKMYIGVHKKFVSTDRTKRLLAEPYSEYTILGNGETATIKQIAEFLDLDAEYNNFPDFNGKHIELAKLLDRGQMIKLLKIGGLHRL